MKSAPSGPEKNEQVLALVEEMNDIKDCFLELIERAEAALRDAPASMRARAECYWLAHIRNALDRDHGYLGGPLITLDETIEEISAHVDERAEV
jgi:hypothetical protein